MKPRTSISSSAAVASSKYGSNNTCGGSSINNIFTQIGSTPGPVKEGLVSQIASRFQQVGVANFTESEADKLISKRKTSEPIKSVHKHSSSNFPALNNDHSRLISTSGDSVLGTQTKDGHRITSPRKTGNIKSDITGSSNRTDSHQARFHNARAMFEKMGSADDLDSIPASPTVNNVPSFSSSVKPFRALSVGSKPTVPEYLNNNRLNSSSITASYNSSLGVRSRSTSPFGGSRSSSQSSLKQGNYLPTSENSNIVRSASGNFVSSNSATSPVTNSTNGNGNMATTPTSDNSITTPYYSNGLLSTPKNDQNDNRAKRNGDEVAIADIKLRKTSEYKSPFSNSNNDETFGQKTSIGSIGRPNIKELTNKQRNWFSNFERGKTSTSASTSGTVTPENVESSRRTSVKQDNIPNLLSGLDKSGNKSDLSISSVPDASPAPSANLNKPGDRRPLNALSSCSSDSIEDYIRNWKGDTEEQSLTSQCSSLNNSDCKSEVNLIKETTESSGPSSLNSEPKYGHSKIVSKINGRVAGAYDSSTRQSEKNFRPPVLSPKPNPDVVKRFSFNKNKQTGECNSLNPPSSDEASKSSSISKTKYDIIKPAAGKVKVDTNTNTHQNSYYQNGAISESKNKFISPNKNDVEKLPDNRNGSRNIVRKLSAEYNSKIQQEDSTSRLNGSTSCSNRNATAVTPVRNHTEEKLPQNKDIHHATIATTEESSVTSEKPRHCSSSESHERENIDEVTLIKPKVNGSETKCNSSSKSKTQVDSNLEKEKSFSANNDYLKPTKEPKFIPLDRAETDNHIQTVPNTNDKDSFESENSSRILPNSHASNQNSMAEKVPFLGSNGAGTCLQNSKTKSSINTQDITTDTSPKSSNLDLQLKKIFRPNVAEYTSENKMQQINYSGNIRSSKEGSNTAISPNMLDCEENNNSNTSNIDSPNITVSGSFDSVLEKKSENEQDISGDEFQDEINFDPTISSGHLGFDKEGDFRNTPITVGGARDAITTPQLDASYLQAQVTPKDLVAVKPNTNTNEKMIDESLPLVMSPKEEENLLSNKIIERKGVLSDEQAEEVKALLTPDKELPPLPSDDFSQIEKSSSSTLTSSIVDSAINKLDSLVYSGVNEESVSKDIAASNSTSNQSKCDTNTQEEPKTVYERPVQHEETYFDKDANVHYYSDGHYWFEIPGLDSTENANLSPSERLPPGCYKKPGKLRFSTSPMKQYSTYAIEDYDRRNDDVDPVAASGMQITL